MHLPIDVAFCREQRPFLPANLKNAEREQTLGMRVDCVDMKSHRVPQPCSWPHVRGHIGHQRTSPPRASLLGLQVRGSYPWREDHTPLYIYVHHRRWKTLSKAEKSRFERAAPSQSPTAPAPSFEYHPANGIQPQNLLPATPAPATVFWFGYHSSPEAICRAPSPTAAVAVPARTLAPTAYEWCGRMDATRTAAPALPVAPSVPNDGGR